MKLNNDLRVKNAAINETTEGSKTASQLPNTENDDDFVNIEAQAKRILVRIPSNLQIYVAQSIADFYKQVEEYEHWKSNTAMVYLNGP